MNRIQLASLLAMALLNEVLAQPPPSPAWARVIAGAGFDEFRAVAEVSESLYIAGGCQRCNKANPIGVVVALDERGNDVWSREIPGAIFSAIEDAGGDGVFCAGSLNDQQGTPQPFLIRMNLRGDTVWTRRLGGVSSGKLTSLLSLADGGILAAGTNHLHAGDSARNIYCVRATADGDTIWTREYDIPGEQNCGTVAATSDGFVLGGSTETPDGYRAFVIKCDTEGSILWTRTYESAEWTTVTKLLVDTAGGCAALLWHNRADDSDMEFVQLDREGEVVAHRKYGQTYDLYCSDMIVTISGRIAIAGALSFHGPSKASILLLDSTGDSLWTWFYQSKKRLAAGLALQQTRDGGFLLVGNISRAGTGAGLVVKTRPDPEEVRSHTR